MNNVISFPKLGLEFNINRAMFTVGGFSVYWYGFIISVGLILAVVYGYYECKRVGFDTDDFFNILIISLPISIIFARLYYVAFNFSLYKDNLVSVLYIRNGGLAVYGGIIGAILVIFLYCRKKGMKIGTVLDILAIGLLIGQSVGRWGNFVNGEAFGSAATLPWAMSIKTDGIIIAESVHPTFLYESVWNLIGIFALIPLKKHKSFEGEVFCYYMIWYGFARFFIEGLRADSLYFRAFRISQLFSAAIFITAVVIVIFKRFKGLRKKG